MSEVLSPAEIYRKYERLLAVVAASPGWVAFSGGVDSSLLLQASVEVDRSRAVALFADSPLQSLADRENAVALAHRLGAQLRMVTVDPLLWPDFVANPPERCYLCKKSLYHRFQSLLPPGSSLFDGTNLDDLAADRPGQRALAELGVVSPLALVGLRKAEVREAARRLGLPNWNRPAASCLATRIPSGFRICQEDLRQVEEYECLVRNHGFGHVRVRLNVGAHRSVTVELAREEMAGEDFPARRDLIGSGLRHLGVANVAFVGREGVFCS